MDLEKKIAEHKAEVEKLTRALHMNQGALFAFEEMLKAKQEAEKPKPNLAPRVNGDLVETMSEPEGA